MQIHVSWLEPRGFQLEFDHDGRHFEIEIWEDTAFLCEEDGAILSVGETEVRAAGDVAEIQEMFNWLLTGDCKKKQSDSQSQRANPGANHERREA